MVCCLAVGSARVFVRLNYLVDVARKDNEYLIFIANTKWRIFLAISDYRLNTKKLI